MPKAWSSKDERQYEHVKESESKRGSKRAKEIAARTVNKRRSEEGRTKSQRGGSTSGRSKRASSRGNNGNSRSNRGSSSRSGTHRGGNRRSPGPTRDELYQRARELDIKGRSGMNKSQLARAVRGR